MNQFQKVKILRKQLSIRYMSNTPSKNILDEQDVADAASSVSNTENYTIHSDNELVDDDFEGPDAASVYKSVSQSETGQKKKQSWREILTLSFSSLGAIYGDLGTSPLYVLNSIKYKESPPSQKDIYGGISLIFYLFTIIVLFKYVCVVLFIGPNNGEGGQVAIYAKIARYLKICLLYTSRCV